MRTSIIVFLFYVCFVTANTIPQHDLQQQNIHDTKTKSNENVNLLQKQKLGDIQNHNIIGDSNVVHNTNDGENVKKSIIDKQTPENEKHQENQDVVRNHQSTQNKHTVSTNSAANQQTHNQTDQHHVLQHHNTQHKNSILQHPADHSQNAQHRNSNQQHHAAQHQNHPHKNIHLPNHTVKYEKTQRNNTNPHYHADYHQNSQHSEKDVGSSSPENQEINQNHRMNNKNSATQQAEQKHKNHHHKDIHPRIQQNNKQHHSDFKTQKHHAHHKSRMAFKSFDLRKVKKYDAETDIELFENEIVQLLKDIEVGRVNATTKLVLNKYVDELMSLLRTIIMKEDVNTIPLPNEFIKVRHSKHCKLSHGTMKDIATIQREGDVFISHNPTEKKVTLGLPIKFSNLKVHYDYHVKSQIFKNHGGVKGFIENASFHAVFSYYYKSNWLTLDHFDMKHTGKLSVEFTGHNLVDWIINPISQALTHKYHHKIVKMLQNHIQSTIRKNLVELNDNIAKKIHK